jgi:hypothetical protein
MHVRLILTSCLRITGCQGGGEGGEEAEEEEEEEEEEGQGERAAGVNIFIFGTCIFGAFFWHWSSRWGLLDFIRTLRVESFALDTTSMSVQGHC